MEESGSSNLTPGCMLDQPSPRGCHSPTASERKSLLHQDADRKLCGTSLQPIEPHKEGMRESDNDLNEPTSFNNSEKLRENIISRRRWSRSLNGSSQGSYSTCPTRREADMPEDLDPYLYILTGTFAPTLARLLYEGCTGASRLGRFMRRLLTALGHTAVAVLRFIIMESLGLLTLNMMGESVHQQTIDKELEKAMDPQALGLQDINGDLESGTWEEMEMISGPILRSRSNDQGFLNHTRSSQTGQKESEDN